MSKKLHTLRAVASDRKWVSFLHENHPYSLLHWSIAGVSDAASDAWLLQDEVTFAMTEFATLDEALHWIGKNLPDIMDVLA